MSTRTNCQLTSIPIYFKSRRVDRKYLPIHLATSQYRLSGWYSTLFCWKQSITAAIRLISGCFCTKLQEILPTILYIRDINLQIVVKWTPLHPAVWSQLKYNSSNLYELNKKSGQQNCNLAIWDVFPPPSLASHYAGYTG